MCACGLVYKDMPMSANVCIYTSVEFKVQTLCFDRCALIQPECKSLTNSANMITILHKVRTQGALCTDCHKRLQLCVCATCRGDTC